MKTSPAGIAMIKRFEGCRLTAYKDSDGIPTIGYGCTAGVRMGDAITQEEADRRLMNELAMFEHGVSEAVHVPLTQGQFDALVSFTFNLGGGSLVRSTLLKMLNAGDYTGAKNEFRKWDMAGGQHLPGLLTRRMAEATMFANSTPVAAFPDAPLLPPTRSQPPAILDPLGNGLTALIKFILSLFRK